MSLPLDVSVTIPEPFAEIMALIVSVPLAIRLTGPFTDVVAMLPEVVNAPA